MLRDGLRALDAADVVLGPTSDGGYWAIGMRQSVPGLLDGIAWSTERVLEETQRRAADLGLRTTLLSRWTDVDRPEDLAALATQIAARRAVGDATTAQHTAMVLQRLRVLNEGPS
jgi:glycosyltransferase A (GT-A) superfamily protein (DUF2064 family)